MNMITLLEAAADTIGDRVAVGPVAGGFTYRHLFKDAGALAGRVRRAGAEYLLACDENSPALITALFAAAWAGAAYAPLNYRLTDGELRAAASRLTPGLAVVGPGGTDRLQPDRAADRRRALQLPTTGSQPGLHRTYDSADRRLPSADDEMSGSPGRASATRRPTTVESAEVLADPGGGHTPAEPGDWPADPDAPAVLLRTSGTAGPPKSAVLRQRHLLSYTLDTAEPASAADDEAHLLSLPPYHIAAVAAQLSQVHAGRRIVTLARFDADAWIELARDEGVTHVKLVPTMMGRIVEALERRGEELPSIRVVAYGGGKPHRATIMRAMELMPNADFSHAYGLTETTSTVSVLGPDEHRRASAGDPTARARLSSVGKPLPALEVSVRDSRGEETAVGDSGELWVRGSRVAGEYLETGPMLGPDGWFRTSDIGRFDSDGYLHLLGRNDDMIVRGGENVSPVEIEEALLAHPLVVDAAVFAVASPEWGEEAAAAVVAVSPAPTAGELRELVRSRLRSSRVPSRVEFVGALPYNQTGKLLRRVVRERFASSAAA